MLMKFSLAGFWNAVLGRKSLKFNNLKIILFFKKTFLKHNFHRRLLRMVSKWSSRVIKIKNVEISLEKKILHDHRF